MRLFLLDTFCLLLSWRLYRLLICGMPFDVCPRGVIAGLDFALSWGWSICTHEQVDMFFCFDYFVFFHDVL